MRVNRPIRFVGELPDINVFMPATTIPNTFTWKDENDNTRYFSWEDNDGNEEYFELEIDE